MIIALNQQQLIELIPLFNSAADYMHAHGNPTQWPDPFTVDDFSSALEKGELMGILEGDQIVAAFVLQHGLEPTYEPLGIQEEYVTLHKVISHPSFKGGGQKILDAVSSLGLPVYIDTHKNNQAMLSLLERNGFDYQGTVLIADGTPRLVFRRNYGI